MESANYNLNLSEGWLFHFGELDRISKIPIGMSHLTSKAGGAIKELDMFKEGTVWKEVCIPHDWATELSFDKNATPAAGFKSNGTGWYYISFKLAETEIESARLVFNGVLGKCDVFVNGVVAVRNFSGYNRFYAEIGDYLLPGEENVIALYVDAGRWEGWWYEGAGIYRDVYIEFRPYTHFDKEKSFVKAVKNNNDWQIDADIAVLNKTDDCEISVSLQDESGAVILKNTAKDTHFIIPIAEPKLWSPENPYLYTLIFEVLRDGNIVDTMAIKTGLRSIQWKTNEGMFLNGAHYPIKGICCHQDHAGVGAAITKEIMEYRISLLKSLGINAYRCAHHAPDEQLLEICDRLGMLVMVENRKFAVSEEVFKQIDALVYVSRNHTSVFLYSLFNEEPWQNEERGKRIAEKMRARILLHDDTRAVTGAQNGGLLDKSNTSDILDVVGVNYFLKDYDASHERLPEKVIIGTENCPTYATRGIYKSDKDKQYFSCYGDEWPDDFSESLDETMNTIYSKPFVGGCFVWGGFDYRGEPTPYEWPSVLSHWSYHDYCGFPKDIAYYLAAWYKEELFVHLLPHWNFKEGEEVRVCAFTNAETAELYVNGKSKGEKVVKNRRAEWKVPFEEGEIKVLVKRGNDVLYDVVKTAQKPQLLKLEDVSKEGSGVHIINLSVTDRDGVLVPDFCEKVKFKLDNLVLLGVGNGNPTSMHGEKDSEIHFFNGHAQIIVKGSGTLKVSCEVIPDAEIFLKG